MLGERVNALSLRRGPAVSDESRGWYRLASGVMRRPVAVALASAALLLLLAAPMLGVKLTIPGTDSVPAGKPSREVVLTVNRDYPRHARHADLGRRQRTGDRGPAATACSLRIAAIKGIESAGPFPTVGPRPGGGELRPARNADQRARATKRRTLCGRSAPSPGPRPLLVAGFTAEFIDLKESLRQNMPLVVGIIALTTLILLFMLTGSVVLPLKTLLMNLAHPGGDARRDRRRVPVGPARRPARLPRAQGHGDLDPGR